ncbi:hypothetical protein LMA00_07980 [Burkholderia ambifaria]|uniref:DUF6941 family protein n=1 Tax=Burkholderia ambifaria TaxID=152480 RepID=UPI001E57CC29|nr:hypothetical protein [Burkholderia ambifaria]UEP49675.1 hypothetical protein LMA00_07980 [Burkholderia ambifaria]
MEEITCFERSVSALFCDDVRHEVGGKLSLIGVYQHVALVPTFPARQGKLAVFVTCNSPKSKPFKQLTVKIYRGDNLQSEATFSPPQEAWNPPGTLVTVANVFVMEQLLIESETTFRIRAIFDDEEVLSSPALTFKAAHLPVPHSPQ